MRRLGYFKYVMIGLLLLAFGFLAGASVRNWAQAKNTPTTKAETTQTVPANSSTAAHHVSIAVGGVVVNRF